MTHLKIKLFPHNENFRIGMSLDKYREPFKAAVLKHIAEKLDAVEWVRLRSMAANKKRWMPGIGNTFDATASAATLVEKWTREDSASIWAVMQKGRTPIEIGLIDGYPIYYIERKGIYVFGEQIYSSPTLSFWVTHPAWPPGW